jgi:carboxylate-amine ligase
MEIEFHSSPAPTLGIEVELAIVDRETRELRSAAGEVIGALGTVTTGGSSAEGPARVKHELFQSTLEIVTGVCTTVAEARRDLEETLAAVVPEVEDRGLAMFCAGSHPFTDWQSQDITINDRYARLVQEFQWPARRLQIFGIHYHVGVRSGEKAIAIANALSSYIPHFLALSASSPYWLGRDTGLASVRTKVFEALPTAGLPHQLSNWHEFEEFMTTLICARTINSIREVWWDIRPHPTFGTIEVRICDGIPLLRDIAALAALAQSLVEWLNSFIDRGYTLPCPRSWIVKENKWRAARHGLDAQLIANEGGDLVPLRAAVTELVDELSPMAARLGCDKELWRIPAIVEEGPSYLRQRRIVEEGGGLADVVDALTEELRTDRPVLSRRPG